MPNCKKCSNQFEITDKDKKFYKRFNVSEPSICPDCRSQKRLSIRNERNLYKRKCDLCSKDIISIYSSDKPYKVYCQECFWGDKWNALDFGQEYDFDKEFFPQFEKLMQKVPRLGIVNKQSQNSEYCNYSFANKNCYLTFGNHYEEDCLYGHYSTKNRSCMDYLWLYDSELCYECMFSKNCYRSVYLDHCENCTDCYFSVDLIGCENCIGCANLRHKKYYIYNKEYSKEEFNEKLKALKLETSEGFSRAREFFVTEFKKKFPFRAVHQINCENCEGTNHENSRNLKYCFDCTACEDCAYGFQMDETYDSMDMNCMGYDKSEVCYQVVGCSGIFNCFCCDSCWHNNDLQYCQLCFSSKNCFGCVSLQHKEYCILNKQYSKDEYEKLLPRIVDNMKSAGEYGQFFPAIISPFCYNETVAQEYFPVTEEDAKKENYKWKEKDKKEFKEQSYKGSYDIEKIPTGITNEILACSDCGKNYKIIEAELKFYKKQSLPLPEKCPDCRHKDRILLRNPRQLFTRTCDKCGAEVRTAYDPDRPEKIYCEKCYLENVI